VIQEKDKEKDKEKEREIRTDKGKQVMERTNDNSIKESIVTIIMRGEPSNTKEEKKKQRINKYDRTSFL